MLFLVGVVVVIGCVIGGYTAHHGKLEVLWQPTELLIIGGAAVGSYLITNPMKIVMKSLKALKYLFKGTPFKPKDYIELLTVLYTCFKTMRSKGMLEMESHIENPDSSSIFNAFPSFSKNHHAVHFLCDYLRLMTMGVEDYHQLEELMEKDLEAQHHEHEAVANAWVNMGDAFPALGIVAAVLGVIITMGSIDKPPTILGELIGAALVGTFLGILIAYGFVGPIGKFIGSFFQDEHAYLECIKAGLLAHLKGCAPAVSIEFARGVIPPTERPDFATVEQAVSSAPVGG
jgi:chemotaxis protein MotA